MGAKDSMIARTRRSMAAQPRAIFSWYLWVCAALMALPGTCKGFDEGNIARVIVNKDFLSKFGLDTLSPAALADAKGWITAIATAGAVFGCLSVVLIVDRIGRLNALRVATVFYGAGVLGQALSNGNLSALYASRFIGGFGIGGTTVVSPMFLAEIAPQSVRGMIIMMYAACQQLGVVFGFWVMYGVHLHFPAAQQWWTATLFQFVPLGVWILGTFLVPESPRYFLLRGDYEKASINLVRLRRLPADHPLVQGELDSAAAQIAEERSVKTGSGYFAIWAEVFATASNRRRFILLFVCHVLGQWSGANAITQYSPTILGYFGITGDSASLVATGCYAVVKFLSAVATGAFLVDFVGRRRSLILGISLQLATLSYLAIYLGVTTGRSSASIDADGNALRASQGAIAAIYIHACGWSIGWFSMPYLLTSEVFPTRIRSHCVSFMMALHWAMNFGNSRSTSSFLVAGNRYGAFVFFAGICVVSLVFVFYCMPETAGRSLEGMDKLFAVPLHKIHTIAYPSDEDLKPEMKSSATGAASMESADDKGTARHRELA
ncbi:sugar transporter [Leucosporidium creatinivorum]|uniref:Sugar transporter n=1 Tax=Leucosporidium creatinivorum TaxID=106004 RepID=A0A1Y2G1P6_9BASI|nr:sugar transporter [Leucosporidium creatinivorum]